MSAVPSQVATLDQLRKPAAPEANMPTVRMGFDSLQGFELMQRAAKAFSASTLVPKEYQGNIPNCIIALEMANRLGASPLLVAQNLYVVHGRPGWSAKFLIASFNQCGRFSAIRYTWGGTEGKDDWSCQAWAIEKSTNEKVVGPLISIALAKKEGWHGKSGSKWQTIPQLMLMYRAAAWLVNTHAPEISMGLSTEEEMHDVFDAERDEAGSFTVTTDTLRQEIEAQTPVKVDDTTDWQKVTGALARARNTADTETRALIIDEVRDLIAKLPDSQRHAAEEEVAELMKPAE
jgi:hypothetical protein